MRRRSSDTTAALLEHAEEQLETLLAACYGCRPWSLMSIRRGSQGRLGRPSAVSAGATVTDSTVSLISRRQAANRFDAAARRYVRELYFSHPSGWPSCWPWAASGCELMQPGHQPIALLTDERRAPMHPKLLWIRVARVIGDARATLEPCGDEWDMWLCQVPLGSRSKAASTGRAGCRGTCPP
jgi:hypothetical protein